jgi:pyruvate kinase
MSSQKLSSPRRTKIICTMGPQVATKAKIKKLVKAGMNIMRINGSHGDEKQHREYIRMIRQVEKEMKSPIGIMVDLQGPKWRVGHLDRFLKMHSGETWTLSDKLKADQKEKTLPVSIPRLSQKVSVGDDIFFDDGLIHVKVKKISSQQVIVKVVHGGALESRKGINIPYLKGRVEVLSSKDLSVLSWALRAGADFIAMSFVRHSSDIKKLRKEISKRLKKNQKFPQIIAKIEKPQALDDLPAIILESDGVIVARGDLGVEMLPEMVPVVQKRIIEECRLLSRPVIVATQMLDSMRLHPRPTRAEVSDVASAIYAHTDAVMLTGETAAGQYPIQACEMMARVLQEVEDHLLVKFFRKRPEDFGVESTHHAFIFHAMQLATDIDASCVIMLTRKGQLTRLISKFHPHMPVYSMAANETAYRQLSLLWGVFPLEISSESLEKRVAAGLKHLKKMKKLSQKKPVVIVFRGDGADLNLRVIQP